MKIQRWLLTGVIILALCLTYASILLGQGKKPGPLTLPQVVKKVQPSTVVVMTYDEQGNVKGQASGFFVSQTARL